jgi:dTMP kinase
MWRVFYWWWYIRGNGNPLMEFRMFIVIEGLDGSGKSTQARRLHNLLSNTILTCEPSHSPVGLLIRQALTGQCTIDEETLSKLFALDREIHLRDVVEPALSKGLMVICDRYVASNIAYQGENAKKLNTDFRKPDVTLFIDVPVSVCKQRIVERGGSERYDGSLDRVAEGYREARRWCQKRGYLWVSVDGDQDVEGVTRGLVDTLRSLGVSDVKTF